MCLNFTGRGYNFFIFCLRNGVWRHCGPLADFTGSIIPGLWFTNLPFGPFGLCRMSKNGLNRSIEECVAARLDPPLRSTSSPRRGVKSNPYHPSHRIFPLCARWRALVDALVPPRSDVSAALAAQTRNAPWLKHWLAYSHRYGAGQTPLK